MRRKHGKDAFIWLVLIAAVVLQGATTIGPDFDRWQQVLNWLAACVSVEVVLSRNARAERIQALVGNRPQQKARRKVSKKMTEEKSGGYRRQR